MSIDWLLANKEWVFSGIGVAALILALTMGARIAPRLRSAVRDLRNKVFISHMDCTPSFQTVALEQIANANLSDNYRNPPFGETRFGEVPFLIKEKRAVFDTAALGPSTKSVTIEIPPITQPHSVYLLLNAGNALAAYTGSGIGRIQAVFHDGTLQETKLVLGRNIREWAVGNLIDLVTTCEDASSQLVWEGRNTSGNKAVIDRLEIVLFQPNRKKRLCEIVIFHDSSLATGGLGVQFLISAITVEYIPSAKTIQTSNH